MPVRSLTPEQQDELRSLALDMAEVVHWLVEVSASIAIVPDKIQEHLCGMQTATTRLVKRTAEDE